LFVWEGESALILQLDWRIQYQLRERDPSAEPALEESGGRDDKKDWVPLYRGMRREKWG